MTEPGLTQIDQILTDQEIEALRFAEDLYGARAKEAADGLGETLGLDETLRARLVGSFSLKMEGLDFEGRRQIARNLQEVRTVLGGIAVNEGPQPPVKLDVLPANDDKSEAGVVVLAAGILNPAQKKWLAGLYDEETVRHIARLDTRARSEFMQALTSTYEDLRIPRLGPEAKRERSEQITALMSGQSYGDIAESFGLQENTLRARMTTMIGSIKNRVPADKLREIIPSVEASAKLEFAAIQQRWYEKIFDNHEDITKIAALHKGQLAYVAGELGRHLCAAVIRSQGPIKADRRVQEIALLIDGKDYEAIAETTGRDVAGVKSELHHSAIRIKETVPQSDLAAIVKEARDIENQ